MGLDRLGHLCLAASESNDVWTDFLTGIDIDFVLQQRKSVQVSTLGKRSWAIDTVSSHDLRCAAVVVRMAARVAGMAGVVGRYNGVSFPAVCKVVFKLLMRSVFGQNYAVHPSQCNVYM